MGIGSVCDPTTYLLIEEKIRMSDQMIAPIKVADSDLVPEDDQNVLLYWRDTLKSGYFGIGDIANKLKRHAKKTMYRVTEAQVYNAVGRFCGKSGRTVRYYAETAEYFLPEEREDYEELPFAHFVFAKSMDDAKVGVYKQILDYAKANPWISEEGLRIKFCGLPVYLPGEKEPEAHEILADEEPEKEAPSGYMPILNKFSVLSRISSLRENSDFLRKHFLEEIGDKKARGTAEAALRAIDQAAIMLVRLADQLDLNP